MGAWIVSSLIQMLMGVTFIDETKALLVEM